MYIYDGAVIVWCKDKSKIFNDIKMADLYYYTKFKENKNPIWQRLIEPTENKT